jgi:hypothetical protein
MIAEVAITPRSSTTPSITRGVPDDESVLDDVEDSVAEEAVGGAEGVDDFADGVLSDVVGSGALSEGLGSTAVAA